MSKRTLEERRKNAARKQSTSQGNKRGQNARGKEVGTTSGRMAVVLIVTGIVAAGIVGFFLLDEDDNEGTGLSIAWMHSYEKGINNASEASRPAMVYFHTDWCGFCDDMENDTFSKERIVLKSLQFTPILVDGDERDDLVNQYDIEGYPTVVFVDGDENELYRAGGYRGKDQFFQDMQTALEKY